MNLACPRLLLKLEPTSQSLSTQRMRQEAGPSGASSLLLDAVHTGGPQLAGRGSGPLSCAFASMAHTLERNLEA